MQKKKMKVKLGNPKRLLLSLLILVAVILGIFFLLRACGADATQAEIEKLEQQEVTIISKEIKPSIADSEIKAGDIVTFQAEYKYSLANGTVKNFTKKEGLKIETSDASLGTVVNNGVQITNAAADGDKISISVKYEGMSKTFEYQIRVVPPEDSTTDK